MRYTNLKLTNFTVFRDASFDFVPGVNLLVGANGTGKTHALKLLYAIHLAHYQAEAEGFVIPTLSRVFYAPGFEEYRSAGADPEAITNVVAKTEDDSWGFSIIGAGGSEWAFDGSKTQKGPRPVYIPSVDMLAHTRRFTSTYDEYRIDFDQTYRDIVSLLLSPEKRVIDNLGIDIARLTGGLATDVDEVDERFYVTTPSGRFAAPMISEGVRKLTTLVVLIRNGWLRPQTTLFWDEPEVSVNPSLMGELVQAILTLARAGVQVFIATHGYFLLKEFDLQAKQGDVKYFALEAKDGDVAVHPTASLDELAPDKISEQFDSIYDRELTRATGRPRKGANGR
jgi:ABC-type branched-subunit amino acid transport system ATPase component